MYYRHILMSSIRPLISKKMYVCMYVCMNERTTQQPSTKVIIPYIQGQSEAIRRVLKDLDIQTCFTPVSTLRQMLSHPKDPIPTMKKSGVVYRIPCADCGKSYVGQTGRNLSLRIKEHKKAVETFNTLVPWPNMFYPKTII